MELIKVNGYYAAYAKHGNDVNGNDIYLVNIFKKSGNYYYNANIEYKSKKDKNGNIRVQSNNIKDTITDIISTIDN